MARKMLRRLCRPVGLRSITQSAGAASAPIHMTTAISRLFGMGRGKVSVNRKDAST